MGLFGTKPPVGRDEYDWLVACFAWLRSVIDDANMRPELVLPRHPALMKADTGPELFEAVRCLMGMQEWDCHLEIVSADEVYNPELYTEPQGLSACGSFSVENGKAVIRYNSAMLRNPDALAATFAHELCHYLLANAGDPPGGADLMEHSTDVAASYCGFGILLANSARQFEQWTDGSMYCWRSSTQGYLSEQAIVTATALFAALHGHEMGEAKAALKPYLRKDYSKAEKAVAKDYPDLGTALSAVDLLEWSFH